MPGTRSLLAAAAAAFATWLGATRLVSQPLGSPAPADEVCRLQGAAAALSTELRETSGLAKGRRNPALLWTHNDSGNDPVLFGLDSAGTIVARVALQDALNEDWEDLEAGPCQDGHCLYVGDIGDNRALRTSITIYVVPEPSPGSTDVRPLRRLSARYPAGPQDAEALFVLPDGGVHIVTKGRHGDIALYRYPSAPATGVVTLERVRTLLPQPRSQLDRVTSATASPNGQWVAVRTYRTLYLYETRALLSGSGPDALRFDLTPLREKQGEAVTFTDGGEMWLTSEAERKRDQPAMAKLVCALTGGRAAAAPAR
jgi:hypothetical protein